MFWLGESIATTRPAGTPAEMDGRFEKIALEPLASGDSVLMLRQLLQDADVDEGELDRVEAIILSMTPLERANPAIIKGSRRKRIATGSGTKVQHVNQLVKQFDQMRKMMRSMVGGKMPDMQQLAQMSGGPPKPKIRRR